MKDIVNQMKVLPDISIKEALKRIDKAGQRTLFVCDEKGTLLGSLTDGDIRRRVLKTGDLQEMIRECFNRNPVFVMEKKDVEDEAKNVMLERSIDIIPVLDKRNNIVEILLYSDLFKEGKDSRKKIDVPVVIMAGGRGERLDPFTKILPKPLIPVDEKPIVEIIIDKFRQHGVKSFYITLNYKGEMVRTYFDSVEKDYNIEYIWEKEFLGTAGSLKLLPDEAGDTFIVSNCDVVVNLDYSDLLRFHKKNKNILTVVGSIQHHRIPYGIIRYEDGRITKIDEKPEFDFTVNTGVYVLSKEAVTFIPDNIHTDMTDCIEVLLDNKKAVGVYPITQKSYIDIGQWEEYKKHTEMLI